MNSVNSKRSFYEQQSDIRLTSGILIEKGTLFTPLEMPIRVENSSTLPSNQVKKDIPTLELGGKEYNSEKNSYSDMNVIPKKRKTDELINQSNIYQKNNQNDTIDQRPTSSSLNTDMSFNMNDVCWNSPVFNDNPLINAEEIKSMNLFFENELNGTSNELFDSNEKQFFDDFLNTFLDSNEGLNMNNDIIDFYALPVNNFQSSGIFNNATKDNNVLNDNIFLTPSVSQNNLLNPKINSNNQNTLLNTNNNQNNQNNLLSATNNTNSQNDIVNETKIVPGTVPTPILFPRKQRHRSRSLLTDQEKKANHIASEQKRRQNIRMGFRALTILVPSLRGRFVDETEEDGVEDLVKKRKQSVNGGKSASITLRNTCGVPAKSVILAETIEYLKHLKGRVMKLKLRSELLSCQLINRSRFKEE